MDATGPRPRPLENGGPSDPTVPNREANSARGQLGTAPRPEKRQRTSSVPGRRDNVNGDLIFSVGDVIVSSKGTRYIVEGLLGQGTFGQVFRCAGDDGNKVAIKVIKDKADHYLTYPETYFLRLLENLADPTVAAHIVHFHESFRHEDHLCLVFELLRCDLSKLLRHSKRGFPLSTVRKFISELLKALITLDSVTIIHYDIKPQNILFDTTSRKVKLADFGNARFDDGTVYVNIQSLAYRAPEVVLGHSSTRAVDMWSLGCVAAELFLGLILFPAESELDLLARITETVAPLPPSLLDDAIRKDMFYTPDLRLRTPEEFAEANDTAVPKAKGHLFHYRALADIINAYPFKSGMTESEFQLERANREAFADFLLCLLDVDPRTRWTPHQAQTHPFITKEFLFQPSQPSLQSKIAIFVPRKRVQTAGLSVRRPQPRILSRLAAPRLVFHPHQRMQLEIIMRGWLGETSVLTVFDNDALALIARTVANCPDDVQLSLELCRRTVQVATRRHARMRAEGEAVARLRMTIVDAHCAIREAFNTPRVLMISASSRLQRILLAAVHLESRHTGQSVVSLGRVAARLAPFMENKQLSFNGVVIAVESLASQRLILCDCIHNRAAASVALNVPVGDLLYALSRDNELTSLADHLK